MTDYSVKAGDAGTEIAATLKDSAGAVDLTGATVAFAMADAQFRAAKVNAPASVVDAAAGKVSYQWQPGDLDTAGSYVAEFEVSFADGSVATFPSSGYVHIRIVEDLI